MPVDYTLTDCPRSGDHFSMDKIFNYVLGIEVVALEDGSKA